MIVFFFDAKISFRKQFGAGNTLAFIVMSQVIFQICYFIHRRNAICFTMPPPPKGCMGHQNPVTFYHSPFFHDTLQNHNARNSLWALRNLNSFFLCMPISCWLLKGSSIALVGLMTSTLLDLVGKCLCGVNLSRIALNQTL